MRRILLILLIVTTSLLVATGCGEFGQRYEGNDDAAAAAGNEAVISEEKFDDAVRKRDGCTEVEEFDSEGSTHTTDIGENVEYENNPPHSGNHYQVPVPWGLYDSEDHQDVELVHNLEHGHIVVTHKGLSAKEKAELLKITRINPYHLVLTPRKDNPKKGVFLTAWTAQMFCERPSAAGLQYMVDNWRDQGPELFTDDEGSMGDVPKEDS